MVYKENFELVLNRMREIYNNAQNFVNYHIEIDSDKEGFTTISYHFEEIINSYEEVKGDDDND